MEVLGFVAAISQLTDSCAPVITKLNDYCCSVKNAPARAKELSDELQIAHNAVASLKMLHAEFTLTPAQSLSCADAVEEFTALLQVLQKRVDPERTRGVRRATWPFGSGETNRLLGRIQRYITVFSFALNIEQLLVTILTILTCSHAMKDIALDFTTLKQVKKTPRLHGRGKNALALSALTQLEQILSNQMPQL
jgi:hypothetical protein